MASDASASNGGAIKSLRSLRVSQDTRSLVAGFEEGLKMALAYVVLLFLLPELLKSDASGDRPVDGPSEVFVETISCSAPPSFAADGPHRLHPRHHRILRVLWVGADHGESTRDEQLDVLDICNQSQCSPWNRAVASALARMFVPPTFCLLVLL
uniref:Uncharacterized protein n=1 Tax=Mycena chlorophos TaxID=658473 RepID=A0ABQ0L589_MYCCL|nr:predicted protein [Mycena chlorophos]